MRRPCYRPSSRAPLVSSFLLLLVTLNITRATAPPNIVIILVDDLGWNDVSFHGSNQFSTPNIDALAYSGVILHDYYTQPICTPARAALLTGRHPIHNGMQHDVIYAPQPWGLPLSERLLPQYLKSLGYVSRGVGKWHLGFYKADYTPTRRGFDSFFGSWLGHQHHFEHSLGIKIRKHKRRYSSGYDMHRDLNISWEGIGKYSTDLYTEEAETIIHNHHVNKPLFLYLAHTAPHAPFQAPQETVSQLKHVKPKQRQIFSAMVTKVDESVGRVTQALKDKNMLNNTIILFLSDNGGSVKGKSRYYASNYPLRGGKYTLWEGGVRAVGLIWSPLLKAVPRVHHGLFNVQDWLPTLLSAAGAPDVKNVDGVNQWRALGGSSPPPYKTMLHNIDNARRISALRDGKWKLVTGRTHHGVSDGWFGRLKSHHDYTLDAVRNSEVWRAMLSEGLSLPGPPTILGLRAQATISCSPEQNKNIGTDSSCKPHKAPCLFDIERDPCELNNLANKYPNVVRHMKTLLEKYRPVKPNNRSRDHRSYPHHWNNTWTNWGDFV